MNKNLRKILIEIAKKQNNNYITQKNILRKRELRKKQEN